MNTVVRIEIEVNLAMELNSVLLLGHVCLTGSRSEKTKQNKTKQYASSEMMPKGWFLFGK